MSADGSVRTAEGTSRKRRRMSPDASITEGDAKTFDMGSMPAYSAKATEPNNATRETPAVAHTHTEPCHHEQTIRTLHSDLDSMRQLITCKVCQRFMYEPYALSCGHTYCYSCLAEWMGKNHKKSCPDCRANIRWEPSPAYVIRDMVQIFVNRNQLLPDGETSDEHRQIAQEEADILTKDRANTDERQGGLFKGTFSRPSARSITAVHDTSDHVDRCPNCLHEVEDGWCLTCHVRVRASDAETDESDETDLGEETDLSEELDMDIEAEDMTREMMGPWHANGQPVYVSSEEEEDSEEDDHDLTGFVEDEVRWESDADEPDYSFEALEFDDTPQVQRHAPIVVVSDVSDSEDEAESVQPVRRRLVNRRTRPSSRAPVTTAFDSDDDSEDEEDDEDPVPTNSQRTGRRRRNEYVIEPEEMDDSEVESSTAAPSENESEGTTRPTIGGYSPARSFSNESEMGGSSSAVPSEDESEGTTRPAVGGLSPLQYNFSPTHVNTYEHSESGQDSELGVGDESGQESEMSDDDQSGGDEDGQSDDDEDEDDESHGMEMDEPGSDEDSEGSEQSTTTGWDLHRLLVLCNQRLTSSADTFTEPNPRHRLQNLVQHRNRFTDPFSHPRGGAPSERLQPHLPRVSRGTMPLPQSSHRSTQTRAPAHPFNLDSTLNRITAAHREAEARRAAYDERDRALSGNALADHQNHHDARVFAHRYDQIGRSPVGDRNQRVVQRDRRSQPTGARPRQLGSRCEVGELASPSSGSSRTARDDDDDSGSHLMGAMGNMSDDSDGW